MSHFKLICSAFCLMLFFGDGATYSQYCGNNYCSSALGVYCCGIRGDLCCVNSIYRVWWFWFVWGVLFLSIFFCFICVRHRRPVFLRRRMNNIQVPSVVTIQTPHGYNPNVQPYPNYPPTYPTTPYPSNVTGSMAQPPPSYASVVK